MKEKIITLLLMLVSVSMMGQGIIKAPKSVSSTQKTKSNPKPAAGNNSKKKVVAKKSNTARRNVRRQYNYDYVYADSVAEDYEYVDTAAIDTAAAMSVDSGVFYNSGGRFEKNGNDWTEYRNEKKDGYWNVYTQDSEDDTYYYISNSQCRVAVPKDPLTNNVYLAKDGDWVIAYFRAIKGEFNYVGGKFVADFDEWYDVKGSSQTSSGTYVVSNIDDNYYYLKSATREVAVPLDPTVNDFYVKKNNDWVVLYKHR